MPLQSIKNEMKFKNGHMYVWCSTCDNGFRPVFGSCHGNCNQEYGNTFDDDRPTLGTDSHE